MGSEMCIRDSEHVDPIDPVVCKDEVHLIDQNSPVQNSVCYSEGKEIDSSVVLHNVVVEVDPQVFEVASVEESDVVLKMHKWTCVMFWTTMMSRLLILYLMIP